MRCDVLAVGTELLLGQIVDGNSAWIGEQLAAHGIDSLLQVKVGDNVGRITATLRRMLEEADAVIVTGGLGPTHDDVTRDALAAVLGVELHPDEAVAETIRSLFASRGRVMPENNLRQALVPDGATVIAQTRGTAPGLIGEVDGRVVYAVPGVPHEMRDMLERSVLPDLGRRLGPTSVIASRTVRTWGDSESGMNARLDELIARLDAVGDPTLAFLARGWEGLEIRLTTRQPDRATADAVLDGVVAEVRTVLGPLVVSADGRSMEAVVLDQLRDAGLTIGLAESVTGGLVAGRLTAVPGASDVLRGSIVSYASGVKFDLLEVTPGPVVNEPVAVEMAEGARRVLGADVGLGLTGVAGPAEQDGVAVGTVCIAVALPTGTHATTLRLGTGREQVRQFAVINALDLLRRRLHLLTGG
ncbi:MAG: CinA family nicotinamide mononucleotide deamidase-related protein [Acidimicrobiia bacterium]|nr:CinA family nicotinamide mononucleotide deamidase-related protein [Acidimicrobiia bacterium]